jgi:hypothetical protein
MAVDTSGGQVEAGEHAVTALPEPRPTAYRYTLPRAPVAAASVDIGHVAVTIELLLSGELDVITGAATHDRMRAGALTALRAMAKGLMIRGLGSATPGISATAGHRFTQRRHDFRAPNTITFAGDCTVDFTQRWDGVDVTVTGEVGYSLEVTAAGEPARAAGEVGTATTTRGWFVQHEKELASIGMLVLVAVPIAPARLTGPPPRN